MKGFEKFEQIQFEITEMPGPKIDSQLREHIDMNARGSYGQVRGDTRHIMSNTNKAKPE